ncbi:MAG: putative DCC family thiol-disulfide oxidoreductase YuxK [Candidatus Arcticimaribacter sp.]|jgi:predicted DCC family thiol-disulfide oxidoreductase YuxK
MDINHYIVLFDGDCNLCNRSVKFIIKRDLKAKFRFTSLQSKLGQSLLSKFNLPSNKFDSFVLIKEDNCFLKSNAALEIVKEFNGVWKWLPIFKFIPLFIRDYVYDVIANNRHKILPKQASCMIPNTELKQRFLE